VSVIDLDSLCVTATYEVASGVTALAAGPDGKRVYAGRATDDRVELTVIDTTAERVGTIDVGTAPAANIDALRVDANGKRLYVAVTDAIGSQLVVLDAETTRVTRVVPVGSPIRDIACAGDAIYVLTSDRATGGVVHAIDLPTGKVAGTVVLGGAPTQLSVSPDEARAYVVDYDRVAVLDTLNLDVVESLRIAARPSAVASTPDGSRLFVADFSGSVTVFAVESTIDMLYSQFLATDPIALSAPRVLQPVTA
jgi:DNA-binding beta-propeller fold protein YncE